LIAFAKELVELDHAVAEQVLEADHHRRLEPHAERFVDHVHDPDARPSASGCTVTKPSSSTPKWPEPQRLKP
jgi:hypothetical protein